MVFEVRIVATLGLQGGCMSGAFWDAGKALFLDLAASNMGMPILSKFIELTPLCTRLKVKFCQVPDDIF